MQSFFDMGKGEYQIMANLTKYEMETVVNYNAGEQTATVYTRDKSVMPYSMPKSFVTYRKPRAVSNEQREQARRRMAKLNSAGN